MRAKLTKISKELTDAGVFRIAMDYGIDVDDVSLTIDMRGFDNLHETLRLVADHVVGRDKSAPPEPTKAILSNPATIVFFDDGTKVVTKAHDGDWYDPVFGIMACAVRKLTRNRGHAVDEWEDVIGYLAGNLSCPDDMRLLADVLGATADALDLDGVMDEVNRIDAANVGTEPATKAATVTDSSILSASTATYDRISVVEDRVEEVIRERERTRQTIRDLVERGEL